MKALEVILIVSNLLFVAVVLFIFIMAVIEESKGKSACQKRNEELRDVINETGTLILEILKMLLKNSQML